MIPKIFIRWYYTRQLKVYFKDGTLPTWLRVMVRNMDMTAALKLVNTWVDTIGEMMK